ncbi:MAG: T9SS type A sorting domain-containing protein [Vicingaceae bacterium]|nr:T9SS type A sorting domain-containing protein [Vicingaceae bacterium]
MQVYPNPVSNELTISIEDVNGIYMLNMYQISGKLIIEEKLNTSISNIDVSSLENGIYFYEIISESGERLTGKVSVVR